MDHPNEGAKRRCMGVSNRP